MLKKTVENWFTKLKSRFFFYKDGFFEVPYLDNSPQTAIESMGRMPFTKHDKKNRVIKAIKNHPFVNGALHYQEVEEGLWLVLVDIRFKKNIHLNPIIDERLSSDYYTLAFQINKMPFESNKPAVEGGLTYDYEAWALIKPGKTMQVSYFKNTNGLFYIIFFDGQWFEKNVLSTEALKNSELNAFLASNQNYIIWPKIETDTEPSFDAIWNCIQQKGNQGAANPIELKIHTLKLIYSFLIQLSDKEKQTHYFHIKDFDRKIVLQAERIIIEHLLTEFPRIEDIAKRLHISPSKLKNLFKTNFGMPMYQYYLSKKMAYAKELLSQDTILIKDIAHYVGYENVSKFSATFKKHHGYLPSNIHQQKKH
jgi:AraC-like DNA-binding protein